MNYLLLRAIALPALVLLATACAKTDDATPVDASNDNLLLGNPSGAVASTNSPTN